MLSNTATVAVLSCLLAQMFGMQLGMVGSAAVAGRHFVWLSAPALVGAGNNSSQATHCPTAVQRPRAPTARPNCEDKMALTATATAGIMAVRGMPTAKATRHAKVCLASHGTVLLSCVLRLPGCDVVRLAARCAPTVAGRVSHLHLLCCRLVCSANVHSKCPRRVCRQHPQRHLQSQCCAQWMYFDLECGGSCER